MRNDYLKKTAVTSIALSLLLSASIAFQQQNIARAEANQLHNEEHGSPSAENMDEKQRKIIPIFHEAAEMIGMNTDELIQEVQKGKSIAEVAKARGMSEKKLMSKLLTLRTTKLSEAVKEGKITKENANKIKVKMSEHLKFMLNKNGLPQSHQSKKNQHKMVKKEQIASMLGITKEELVKQLEAGRSLSEIAQEKGMSRDQLIEKIKEHMTPFIERSIDTKPKIKTD